MKDKVKLLLCAMICTTLVVCGILFWPTFYRYDKIEGKLPVRVNRITGYTEILYPNRRWEPVKNVQPIPHNERNKVKVLGYFNSHDRIYKGEIYNGTSYTLKKIWLSIGAKRNSGKIEWQKIYETPVDIAPFSKGYCSIGLIDTKYFDSEKEKTENVLKEQVDQQWQPAGPAVPLDKIKPAKLTKEDLIGKAIDYAREYNVRPDIYLAVINQGSQFNPDAKSSTGVRGISQIPLEKGKAYGILNNEDRANPDKMLRAGAAYLRDLFNEKGNWSDAVMAYNGGSDPNFQVNVAKHLPWARRTLAGYKPKAAPDWELVSIEPLPEQLSPEVKLEEIFGYKGE